MLQFFRGKKKRIWIPALCLAAAAGLVLFLHFWPLSADKAYDFSLITQSMTLPIENGIPGSEEVYYSLIPQDRLSELRAARSFAELPLRFVSSS